ncbi:MAG: FAD-dependent oxidoreductase [Desulfobacteraceae bacterium]|nr:FAD-dependent oxidoreductase [Desulfobacteraceae bacterium]
MAENILIIGGVAAGPKTACRLQRLRSEARITIVDQDNLISYGGCGIPYYVSGDVSDEKELRSTSFHAVRDPLFFENAKGVKVLTRTRAQAIDRKGKRVSVTNLDTGQNEELAYDKLVLCTGSSPNRVPIPGSDLPGVFVIGDMHQAIAIKELIAKGKVSRTAVIGGGPIGIEMAESFGDLWGLETTIIELMPQVLPRIVDPIFAGMLAHHLAGHGIRIFTDEKVQAIRQDGESYLVVTDRREVPADLVVMAVGVRPRSELAREAGLLVGPLGGIVVNNRMQTSDPHIYAAGDCVETNHLVSGKRAQAPFGSLANRQGRVVADNLAGIPSIFPGVVNSFIMKAFEVSIGATGLSLEVARAEGFDADRVITAQSDRAHFFPTQAIIPLEMVFDRRTRRVLGVQGFGPMGDAVLARLDAAAALIAKAATVEDFINLEMAYAPPFATALDALNATANVAENALAGRLRTVSVEEFMAWMDKPGAHPEWLALDIRHPNEAKAFCQAFGERWLAIPYVEVRARQAEIPTDRTLIIICDAGTRSYEIQCLLDGLGRRDSLVLAGGFNLVRRLPASWWPK